MKSQQGWTLIELAIATSVAAIMFGIAVPTFTGGLEAARAADARADLHESFMVAINQAVTVGARTVLCPGTRDLGCLDDPDWSGGWLVFIDANGSRELEGGERLLRAYPALPGRVHLRTTKGRTRIVFQASGANHGSNVTFTLCDGRGPERAVTLVLANTGSFREGVPSAESAALTCPR